MLLADYFLSQGNTSEAIRYFQEFLSREPDDEESAFDFAMHLLEIGWYDEVLQLAGLMGRERGLPLEAHVLAAWGDHEEALEVFERYISLLTALGNGRRSTTFPTSAGRTTFWPIGTRRRKNGRFS